MKKNNKALTVSIIVATYNSERTLDFVLKSIKKQVYPMSKIEIIIVDGGSKDKTLEIAQKYNTKIVYVPSHLQNAEYNKGVGIQKAKNEIVILVDHDNILPHKYWIKRIIQPFVDHKDIVGVEPLRFHYDPKMTLLDRYFALLGGNDPVAYYLGKDSHLSWAFDSYNLLGTSYDMGNYYLVQFDKDNVPALGGNGAAIKRKLLLREAQAEPEYFFHIDVNVDLIKKGFNKYAFIKDSIIHLTNNKVFPFLKRRKYFIEKYYYQENKRRRYSVYDPKKDRMKLVVYVILSVTMIKPLFDAMRGFTKVQDIAWFIHPFMCFGMLVVYGIPMIKEEIRGAFAK